MVTEAQGNSEMAYLRSVTIQVITKAEGIRFVYRKYDYRPNFTTQSKN